MTRNTRLYTDIDAAFEPNPITGDLTVKSDDKAIKFAIKSLVLTMNYERPFQSHIGTPVKKTLFDQMDDFTVIMMKEMISNLIRTHEPRVDLLDVIVDPSYDNNSLYINVVFRIKNTERPLNVGVTLERTR